MKTLFKSMMMIVLLILFCLGSSAQKTDNDFPNYSNSPRSEVPAAFRWQLQEIFKSPADWQQALLQAGKQLERFKALLDDWQDTPAHLADCLNGQELLQKISGRLTAYASLSTQIAWSNPDIQDMNSLADRFYSEFSIQSSRLVSRIGAMKSLEKQIAAEPQLKPFAVYMRELIRSQSHDLPLKQEEMLAQMQPFLTGPRTVADCLRNLDMPRPEAVLPNNSKLPMTGANRQKLLTSALAAERQAAHEASCLNRTRFENTFAALLDTRVKQDYFNAKVRHYHDSLSAELFPYDVLTLVYRNLISTVKKNLGPYHRYHKLRKKILGLEVLHPYDDYLPLVSDRPLRYSFAQARQALESATRVLGPEYSALVRQAYDDHWIDAYGHQDKMNQGSAQSFLGVHPYVNLDYRGSFFDMITVAHELGHALSFHIPEQAQPFSCAQISWFVSEVPSTFNEILVMRLLIKETADDKQKLALLDELISRLNLLLFESVQGAEMQLAMHEQVERGGTLSPVWLNAKQLELTRLYRGQAEGLMVIDEYVKSDWNTHTAFFSAFQDYYYAVGSLVSLAMIERIDRQGEVAAQDYMNFLKSGGSRSIMDVLKDMGVDLGTAQPIERALSIIDDLVGEMEVLADKIKSGSD